jgi:hypothetical protein
MARIYFALLPHGCDRACEFNGRTKVLSSAMALRNAELADALATLERQMADEPDVAAKTQLAHRVAALRREQAARRKSPELALLLVNSASRAQSSVEMPAASHAGAFDSHLRWPASHARGAARANDSAASRCVRIDAPATPPVVSQLKRVARFFMIMIFRWGCFQPGRCKIRRRRGRFGRAHNGGEHVGESEFAPEELIVKFQDTGCG